MRIILLFIFAFSSFVCFGQTNNSDQDLNTIQLNSKNLEIKPSILNKKNRKELKLLRNSKSDYLKPYKSTFTEMLYPWEGLNIDSFYLYKAWQAKKIKKHISNRNYLDILIDGSHSPYLYYLHFTEENDTLQILQISNFATWRQASNINSKTEKAYYFELDMKLISNFQKVCKKAISQTRENIKGFGLDGSYYVFAVNYETGYLHTTHADAFRVSLLSEIVAHIDMAITFKESPDISWLREKIKVLMLAYEIE